MKKIILFLLVLISNCFAQYNPQFNRQPEVGYQINLAHPDAQGLLGRWLVHEGLGLRVYDLSPYGNDGVLTLMDPATDWVVGRDGWALDFDGADDYLNMETVTLLDILDKLTILVWIRLTDLASSNSRAIVSNFDTVNDAGILFRVDGDENIEIFKKPNQIGGDSGLSITDTNWHFLAYVWDGTTLSAFMDGIQGGTTYTGSGNIGDSAERLFFCNEDRSGAILQAQISSILIYNRALTAEEIISLFIYEYAMFEQPPGRILAAVAAAARRIMIFIN